MRIGVDLGGTKIEAILLDDEGTVLARRRVPTPAGSYEATLAAIRGLVTELETGMETKASVGVGMPGAISPKTGLVKNANSTWLNGRPFDRDLTELLGRPVRFANDADCFALSEATDGAAAGLPVVFGVILGTGVGGGIVIAGKLLSGADAIAGEWGHNPLPWPSQAELPGPPCYCGKRGCIETWLSGPGLARDYGGGADAAEIAARAEAGEPGAAAALERYADRLARGLASVINVIDPHAVVLGGGLSKIAALYERVPDLLTRYVFSDRVAARLLPPLHGDSSGVRGAAWLW
ncbi:MAG: ROK family protein [Rhodospirillales bacterium]|nr:ROK family protein [Rhodospirillales bacterium]